MDVEHKKDILTFAMINSVKCYSVPNKLTETLCPQKTIKICVCTIHDRGIILFILNKILHAIDAVERFIKPKRKLSLGRKVKNSNQLAGESKIESLLKKILSMSI